MRKTFILVLLGTFMMPLFMQAQSIKDPVVIEIGNEKITKSQLMKNFQQANGINTETTSGENAIKKRNALQEYVDLFINFRLKIADAIAKQYDTLSGFKAEYETYRNELAAPYLIDSKSLDNILQEIYTRNQQAIRASHIMIKVDRMASPEDTLKAYKKAMDIYAMVKEGANFTKTAIQFSEDPSARLYVSPQTGEEIPGNGGDLGYFTVFNMVFPFEDAAYNLKIGEISKPVRSDFGYHIIKLDDKINVYGKTTIQHIWVGSAIEKDSIRMISKINDAYRRLKEGESFETIVKDCSEDRSTTDGIIENVSIQQIVPEYVKAIGELQEGEYGKPFKTKYGWHILKVLTKEKIAPIEDMMVSYKQRITRDQRSKVPQHVFVEHMKTKYNFVDYAPTKQEALKELENTLTDSLFKATWKIEQTSSMETPIFTIDGKIRTIADFAKYIEDNQRKSRRMPLDIYFAEKYQGFINQEITNYTDSRLEIDYPDFLELITEYRNGLLIFAYNDAMIWSKAIKDTTGLKEFYATKSIKHNINDPSQANYFWQNRANIMTVSVFDSTCIDKKDAYKIVEKNAYKKGMTPEKMTSLLHKKIDKKKCSLDRPVYVRNTTIEEGNNEILEPNQFQKGIVTKTTKEGYIFVVVKELIDPSLKNLSEARGYYINDYQNELEKQLIEKLRKESTIIIHQNELDSITW